MPKPLKILALSDRVVEHIYSPQVKTLFPDVDFVLGCGDLPYYYLEYVLDTLNVPVFFVRGNHDPMKERTEQGEKQGPWGADDLHRKIIHHNGLILAGFEGSIRYSKARYQYTQLEMWFSVISMIPKLLKNRLALGRYLDLLVTHSPSWGVNDGPDHAHHGFRALRWFVQTFKPAYHFHGHIHNYEGKAKKDTIFHQTKVINAFSYRVIELELGNKKEETQ